jgi:aminopeptidase N
MEVIVGAADTVRSFPVELDRERVDVHEAAALSNFQFVLPTGGGLAYGDFVLDDATGAYLLEHLLELEDPVTRGAAWVTLWEEMLGCRVAPATLVTSALRALPREDVQQIVQLIVNYLREIYWRFLSASARKALARTMETALREGMMRAAAASLKATYFQAFRSTALGPESVAWLERVWAREEQIPGLALAESDEARLALELAVRSVPQAGVILEEQLSRFTSADRRERFQFVMPALSDRTEVLDAFFARLANVKNRRREPWVIEGLSYLNHPLRASQSAHYVYPALELLPEIQRTGDIFFPKNWMDAVLHGHNTADAADTVRKFLSEHTDYPVRLRRIILQSADGLLRAVRILSTPGG